MKIFPNRSTFAGSIARPRVHTSTASFSSQTAAWAWDSFRISLTSWGCSARAFFGRRDYAFVVGERVEFAT